MHHYKNHRLTSLTDELGSPGDVREFVLAAIPLARTWASERYGTGLSIDGSGALAVEGLLNEFDHIKGTMELLRQDEYFHVSPGYADQIGRDFTTLAIFKFYEHLRCEEIDTKGDYIKYRYPGDATYDLAKIVSANDQMFTWETHPLRLDLGAVFLDEMHDTNWAMFTVLKELLAVNEGVQFLGVGDRDQVVHAEHGADSIFMGDGFDTYIGRPERLRLTESYRSGREITEPLGQHASKAYLSSRSLSSKTEVKKTKSAFDVLDLISDALTRRPGLQANSPRSQLAVLLRHPSAAVELEHALRGRAIKYEVVDFTTYLERPEVLYVRTLLALAVGLPDKFSAGIDVIAKRSTWAFISATSIAAPADLIENAAMVEKTNSFNFFHHVLPDALAMRKSDLLRSAVHPTVRTKIQRVIKLASTDDVNCLAEVLDLLDIETMARRVFVRAQEAMDAKDSVDGLLKAGRSYASITQFLRSLMSHDYDSHSTRFAGDRIILSSIEAAKGLEFEHVIIPDVDSTNFDDNAPGERNLFYVAASRAKNMLTLAYGPGKPSSFLRPYR